LKLGDVGEPPAGPCSGVDYIVRFIDTPVFRVWAENPIHVADCEIVPVATYQIRATTDEVIFSEPLVIGTVPQPLVAGYYYADVVGPVDPITLEYTPPDGYVNVTDISGYLFANQARPKAPHTTWVDLHGVADYQCGDPPTGCIVPQQILNVSDLQTIIFGYQGQTYDQTPGQVAPGDCP